MKALISPSESPIRYISSWNIGVTPIEPVYKIYPNSCRVAQVEPDANIFPVAEPLFWTDCADDVVADWFYYNTVDSNIYPIVNAPIPAEAQPQTTGTQSV
jgi:hypothetical protein